MKKMINVISLATTKYKVPMMSYEDKLFWIAFAGFCLSVAVICFLLGGIV